MSTSTTSTGTGSPGAPTAARRRPERRREYAAAALVAVAGLGISTTWAITGLVDQIQEPRSFARADVPGAVTVRLTQTGPHVVYVEAASPTTLPVSLLTVTDPEGADVEVRTYRGDLRYDVPDRPGAIGTAVGVFDADRTGVFTVGTAAVAPVDGARLAAGDDLAPAVTRAVVLPALTAVLSVVAAIGLALGVLSRADRRPSR